MSRSATPATRNEATKRLKPPKITTSAELPIGTAIWSSRGRLRTVANGCERLRTVALANATSSEHTLNPQTPRVKREPLLRIREKVIVENTSWQLNPTDTGYLDVQCTGLGGGELDKDWEVLLACRKEAHVYGPFFFVAGAIVFRLVTTLEAYLRTSGESNHHR